ncbi:hypothetical protein PG987_013101 [Apiospora arundinis]
MKQKDDDSKQLVLAGRHTNRNQPSGTTNQEDDAGKQNTLVRHSDTHQGASSYDWAGNLEDAKERAVRRKIVKLPADEVGRLVIGGQVRSLWNENRLGARYFISYDGIDVLARVPVLLMMDTVIHKLAALHIGRLYQSSHPDDIELQLNWYTAPDNTSEGFAIHIHPRSKSNLKNTDLNF